MMFLSDAGATFIQGFERCVLQAYNDQRGVPTIGWGHTGDIPSVCTQQQADQWFLQDTQTAVRAVLRTVDVPMTQNQFDALCSFTYNVGIGSEAHSTLVSVLNAGNYMMAAEQFLRWDHVNGVVDPGLTRRREAERALFLST